MPGFIGGPAYATPFGKRIYLRSTRGLLTRSKTVDMNTVPIVDVDGTPTRVLQPGVLMAEITVGNAEQIGKIGPYQPAGTDEVQSITELAAISAGVFTVTVLGETTADIAFDATASEVQAALRLAASGSATQALAELGARITVTGGPVGTAALIVTYDGSTGVDVTELTVDVTGLTGTVTVATDTPGVAGSSDGRGLAANILGFNDTFLPDQLLYRDVEVSVVYGGSIDQSEAQELTAAGAWQALSDTTRDLTVGTAAMQLVYQ